MLRGYRVIKWLLTILLCNVRLIWHHSPKGTSNEERNADDSSYSPLIWMCNWPVHEMKKQWWKSGLSVHFCKKDLLEVRGKPCIIILPECVRNSVGVAKLFWVSTWWNNPHKRFWHCLVTNIHMENIHLQKTQSTYWCSTTGNGNITRKYLCTILWYNHNSAGLRCPVKQNSKQNVANYDSYFYVGKQ